MFDQVGHELFDDDAQARLIPGTKSLVRCVTACRGDRIAEGSGTSNVAALPIWRRFA